MSRHVGPDRLKMTWERLLQRINDPEISDGELCSYLRMASTALWHWEVTPEYQREKLFDLLVKHAREICDNEPGTPTSVGKTARIMMARNLSSLTRGLQSTSDWRGISDKDAQTITRVVQFYAEERWGLCGNDADKRLVREFLARIWRNEDLTRAGRVSIKLIEKALVWTQVSGFLVSNRICRAIPELYKVARRYEKDHDPTTLPLMWSGWSAFPASALAVGEYRILEPEKAGITQAMREDHNHFTADCIKLLRAASIAGSEGAALSALLSHATWFRHEVRTTGIDSIKQTDSLV